MPIAAPHKARNASGCAFAQAEGELQGDLPLDQWPRLNLEQAVGGEAASAVRWRLQGHTVPVSGGPDEVWLDLEAEVALPMQCQRCLKPVLSPVLAERSFRFVADEATAAALDDEAEEDILVLSRDFDALALVEDELIMSLPLVPLHEVCPEALPVSAVACTENISAAAVRDVVSKAFIFFLSAKMLTCC